MKSTILALLFGLSLSTFAFADYTVARCQSDCWLDRGDFSGLRHCFIFNILTDGVGNYRAEMIGGTDDDGNYNNFDLGPVRKSVSADGGMKWTTQPRILVKSINFKSMTQSASCTIIDSYNKIYQGTTLL